MKKISILFLWLLIIASGIAGFFFAPLWAFTALALYLLYKMSEEDVGLGKAVKKSAEEVGRGGINTLNAISVTLDEWNWEQDKKKEAITFDDIHDAIRYLVDGKKADEVSVWNVAYLSNDIQYQYLKSGQWERQGGYHVYCDEYDALHFGYDYQGKHWGVVLWDNLRIAVTESCEIEEGVCFGSKYEKRCKSKDELIELLCKKKIVDR